MSIYCYLDFSFKLAEEPEKIESIFVKGALINSLNTVFGEIGGLTEVDLLKFDETRKQGILRVSIDFEIKLRTALSLIRDFQGIPASFRVNKVSQQLPSLVETFIEF